MSKRDFIAEIKELQKRLPDEAHTIFGHQGAISELITLYPAEGLSSAEEVAITHYITVRLVAVLQSAFRAVIRSTVDYNARHKKPLPKVEERITLEMVHEFATNAVTLGEFVSHLMPLNSFSQMESSFEVVAGTSLQRVIAPHLDDNSAKKTPFSDVKQAIHGLFKERNVICHEMREAEAVAKHALGKWLIAVLLLVTSLGIHEAQFIELSLPSSHR
ncbi:MAG: hypothetical protein M3Y86_10180 [Verrucomicrobiota bacterium]|nr:hypothetical protein [Verrucomicrobiota bacterium]